MKISIILLFFLFIVIIIHSNNNNQYFPFIKNCNPRTIENEFLNLDQVNSILKSKKANSLDLFKAGIFCMYNVYELLNKIKINKENEKIIVTTAKQCFEKAYKKENKNPFIIGYRGVCYLYLCKWGALNEIIQNGEKGYYYLNKAIKIYPDSFEIRRIRIVSFIYLPFQYYPNAPNIIRKDIDFIINKLSNYRNELLSHYSENDIKYFLNEIYYMKSIFHLKLNQKTNATSCLDKMDKNSLYYKKLSDYINND